ncbi:MAG: biotin--[acetyl-CoA-carboxylase] ligase [Burkholderiales bacterium]
MDRLTPGALRVPGVTVRVVEHCGSTNSILLAERLARPTLLATDLQTAGRGRRGRRWHSPKGYGVLFSLGLPLGRPARALGGLSIVAGMAVVRALRALGATDAALKWPNDVLVHGRKLGGILVETRAQGGGSAAVIGVGLNHRQARGLAARLHRGIAALEDLLVPLPARTTVISALARELLGTATAFDLEGFAPFRGDWESLHAHRGERLQVRMPDGRRLAGVAAGLAEDGALRLRTRRGLLTVRTGRIVMARPA